MTQGRQHNVSDGKKKYRHSQWDHIVNQHSVNLFISGFNGIQTNENVTLSNVTFIRQTLCFGFWWLRFTFTSIQYVA